MTITQTYEPIRSIYAPDDGSAYAQPGVLRPEWTVHYGESHWPSKYYWLVPGTGAAS